MIKRPADIVPPTIPAKAATISVTSATHRITSFPELDVFPLPKAIL